MPQTIGIIGYGAFGSFVAELAAHYLPEMVVKVHSSKHAPDGTRFFTFAEVAGCDIVVPAVPISAMEETLSRLAAVARPETIVVDVATVKAHTVGLLKRHSTAFRFVATHPMFGPYSYLKKGRSLQNLRLVICEHTLSESELAVLKEFLQKLGIVVLEMSADEHDRMLAETLFLTHLVGQAVTEGGFRRTSIDTVSFGFLMDAVESVQNDTALFREVYRYNSHCAAALSGFREALSKVEAGL